jgi:hypothetical protein
VLVSLADVALDLRPDAVDLLSIQLIPAAAQQPVLHLIASHDQHARRVPTRRLVAELAAGPSPQHQHRLDLRSAELRQAVPALELLGVGPRLLDRVPEEESRPSKVQGVALHFVSTSTTPLGPTSTWS